MTIEQGPRSPLLGDRNGGADIRHRPDPDCPGGEGHTGPYRKLSLCLQQRAAALRDKDLAGGGCWTPKLRLCEVLSEATGSSPPECLEERSPSTATPSATGTSTATTTPRPVKVRTGLLWPTVRSKLLALCHREFGGRRTRPRSGRQRRRKRRVYPIHMAAQHNANPDVAACCWITEPESTLVTNLATPRCHEAGAFNGPRSSICC